MKTSAYTPFEVGARDRIVGVFVIGATLLFLIGFLIPFIQRFSADEGMPYHTVLDQTYGIAPNATVTMRGVTIGNVTNVRITSDASVRVDFMLSRDYEDFYRQGSRLQVDTNIGVSTILTGSGLILVPTTLENPQLAEGDYIVTDIPQGITSILDELDIVQLTDQVTEIVSNVEQITQGLNQNQHTVYQSLENLEQMTANLAAVSGELPKMTQSIDRSLQSLESTLGSVDKMVATTDKNLQPMLLDVQMLTKQTTSTLAETELLLQATRPVMNQLPTFLLTTDVTLQSITTLTNQLSQSWLFGGGDNTRVNTGTSTMQGPYAHPHDDSLYEPTQSTDL